jgi:hypothetical protein
MPHRRDTWGMAASPTRWPLTWVRSPRHAARVLGGAAGRPPSEFVEDGTRGCQAPTDSGMLALGITSGVLVVASRATAESRQGGPVSRGKGYHRIDRVKFHVAAQDLPDATGAGKGPSRVRAPRHPGTARER